MSTPVTSRAALAHAARFNPREIKRALAQVEGMFRTDLPPGPAGRWLIERLKSNTATRAGPAKAKRAR